MTIGEMIRSHRKDRKMTLEDIGRICNVPRSTVYRWENGEIKKISRLNIERLCNVLGIDPVCFFRIEESLTREEFAFLTAFREADERARQDALKTLMEHKKENDIQQKVI